MLGYMVELEGEHSMPHVLVLLFVLSFSGSFGSLRLGPWC